MGSHEIPADSKAKEYFDLAMADFDQATELDANYDLAFDMKGLIGMANENYDQAIADFTQEMRIKPAYGRLRLTDAYCNRGSFYQRQNQYNEAISDYEKSIEFQSSRDGCSCEPYNPLAWIYLQREEYKNGWDVINKAKKAKVKIDPELIKKLKTEIH